MSFECTPDFAYDTDATITQANELWRRLDRPNVMIKVPGTIPGIRAIEELTRSGVNVNVTLLFALERHEAVAEAYLRGLTRRAEEGGPLEHICSVASFFLSRIDTEADALLDRSSPLRGRAAVASARVAYQHYLRDFSGARWERLRSLGARPQRLLWASTGTKDPAYSDVRYVEQLVGPDVISTMPEQTLEAFAAHGEIAPTLEADPAQAAADLAALQAEGIDLASLTATLEHRGVELFCASYRDLLTCLNRRIEALGGARREG